MTPATLNGGGKTAGAAVIEIAHPDLRRVFVQIKGVTPLICSNGKQALDALLEDRSGKAKTKKITDPEKAYRASLYEIAPGEYGFPAQGIKNALQAAAIRFTEKKGTVVAGALQIVADMLPIDGSEPWMRSDFVKHGGRTPDIAYRGCFDEWTITVPVIYNAEVISEAQVVTLFSLAGFAVGIGAWRPEKRGGFGQFSVEGVER